ncbi:hypothetical protein AA106555_1796 [Neokomagataea thailandica NBRC 106555]|uniref:Uncharacterized protein n=2 Tax=Neokomagataea TaxID=1223423 RepID=A0A4Y6V591_9PROT|nr:hypothetical protein D5366_08675 [Neokomagataea tanensis]GBR54731.1 hypothetical protein AA106555_1796 [Neokomagataea thailandica NBRC 106555]
MEAEKAKTKQEKFQPTFNKKSSARNQSLNKQNRLTGSKDMPNKYVAIRQNLLDLEVMPTQPQTWHPPLKDTLR